MLFPTVQSRERTDLPAPAVSDVSYESLVSRLLSPFLRVRTVRWLHSGLSANTFSTMCQYVLASGLKCLPALIPNYSGISRGVPDARVDPATRAVETRCCNKILRCRGSPSWNSPISKGCRINRSCAFLKRDMATYAVTPGEALHRVRSAGKVWSYGHLLAGHALARTFCVLVQVPILRLRRHCVHTFWETCS